MALFMTFLTGDSAAEVVDLPLSRKAPHFQNSSDENNRVVSDITASFAPVPACSFSHLRPLQSPPSYFPFFPSSIHLALRHATHDGRLDRVQTRAD